MRADPSTSGFIPGGKLLCPAVLPAGQQPRYRQHRRRAQIGGGGGRGGDASGRREPGALAVPGPRRDSAPAGRSDAKAVSAWSPARSRAAHSARFACSMALLMPLLLSPPEGGPPDRMRRRYGQEVALTPRQGGETVRVRAFLQPVLRQREEGGAAVTPLGGVSRERSPDTASIAAAHR